MRNKEDWEILYVLATNEGMKKKDARYEQAYDNIVNLFYEKDKQIDLMAKYIDKIDVSEDFCEGRTMCDEDCVNCIKQYFARLVEKE